MLLRKDFHDVLKQDTGGMILRHFLRAIRIRIKFNGLRMAHTDERLLPNCHEVAHAYARAFDIGVEDGLCTYISGKRIESVGAEAFPVASQFMHSWNVIQLPNGITVILDIFPDIGLSMMPTLHAHPHPAYSIPEDKNFHTQMRSILWDPKFDVSVELLADAFRALDNTLPRS